MTFSTKLAVGGFSFALLGLSASAATIAFDLRGTGGFGLLPTNETNTLSGSPGSGGELGAGILFNDVTFVMTLNTGWGTGNGFTNLSGNATGGHIHGPTASAGTASFTQTASIPSNLVLDSLAGWNGNSANGGFNGTVTFTAAQVADLMAGKFYMNVHTAANGGGEIRGNLVAVPEPAALGLLMSGVLMLGLGRRRG